MHGAVKFIGALIVILCDKQSYIKAKILITNIENSKMFLITICFLSHNSAKILFLFSVEFAAQFPKYHAKDLKSLFNIIPDSH